MRSGGATAKKTRIYFSIRQEHHDNYDGVPAQRPSASVIISIFCLAHARNSKRREGRCSKSDSARHTRNISHNGSSPRETPVCPLPLTKDLSGIHVMRMASGKSLKSKSLVLRRKQREAWLADVSSRLSLEGGLIRRYERSCRQRGKPCFRASASGKSRKEKPIGEG
jgi:hypothetical protein